MDELSAYLQEHQERDDTLARDTLTKAQARETVAANNIDYPNLAPP